MAEEGTLTRAARRFLIVLALGTTLALLATGVAVAGKGGGGKSSSSIALVVVSSTADVGPHYGDQVTFDVSTTATDRPFVNLRCYQDGAWVYDGWRGFFEDYNREPIYTLSAPGYWEGGGADCTARLIEFDRNGRERTLATMDFQVEA
jgi:hypothetical protein